MKIMTKKRNDHGRLLRKSPNWRQIHDINSRSYCVHKISYMWQKLSPHSHKWLLYYSY